MNEISRLGWEAYATVASRLRVAHSGSASTGVTTRTWEGAAVRKRFLEAVVPFWDRYTIDVEEGGYWSFLGQGGELLSTDKPTVSQARMMYSFALAWSLTGDERHLAAARHGLAHLIRRSRDRDHGGWFRSVDRSGDPIDDRKVVVDQAYAIICLAEYSRLTGEVEPLERALATYAALERLWDPISGGYHDGASREWTILDDRKSACGQLDMLLAALLLARATGRVVLHDRVRALAQLVSGPMRDPRSGVLLEWFSRDWSYRPAATRDSLTAGHPLKAVWQLLAAAELLGDDDFVAPASELFLWCRENAWDGVSRTFVSEVYRNGLPARRRRDWWTQCEGMLALVALHQRSGEDAYLDMLHHVLTGTFANFADGSGLEWWGHWDPAVPTTSGMKAWAWKAGYHVAQALSRVAHYLSQLESGHPDAPSVPSER